MFKLDSNPRIYGRFEFLMFLEMGCCVHLFRMEILAQEEGIALVHNRGI